MFQKLRRHNKIFFYYWNWKLKIGLSLTGVSVGLLKKSWGFLGIWLDVSSLMARAFFMIQKEL